MTAQFQAKKVSVNENERDIWSVITFHASDRPYDGDSLTLQRGFKFDDANICIGQIDVDLCWQGRTWISHGINHRCDLGRDRLVVVFDDSAALWLDEYRARHVEPFQRVEVTFDLSDEQLGCLRAGLQQMYEGIGCYVEHAG